MVRTRDTALRAIDARKLLKMPAVKALILKSVKSISGVRECIPRKRSLQPLTNPRPSRPHQPACILTRHQELGRPGTRLSRQQTGYCQADRFFHDGPCLVLAASCKPSKLRRLLLEG